MEKVCVIIVMGAIGGLLTVNIIIPFLEMIWSRNKKFLTNSKESTEQQLKTGKVVSCPWLVQAVKDGDLEKVKKLIAAGSSIHSIDDGYIGDFKYGAGDTLFEVAMKVKEKPFSREVADFLYQSCAPTQKTLDGLVTYMAYRQISFYEDSVERLRYIISKGGRVSSEALRAAIGNACVEMEEVLREEMDKKNNMKEALSLCRPGIYSNIFGFIPWSEIVPTTLEAPNAKVILPEGMHPQQGADWLSVLSDKSKGNLAICKMSVDQAVPLYDLIRKEGINVAIGSNNMVSNASGGVNLAVSQEKDFDGSFSDAPNSDSIPIMGMSKKDKKHFKKKEKKRVKNDK